MNTLYKGLLNILSIMLILVVPAFVVVTLYAVFLVAITAAGKVFGLELPFSLNLYFSFVMISILLLHFFEKLSCLVFASLNSYQIDGKNREIISTFYKFFLNFKVRRFFIYVSYFLYLIYYSVVKFGSSDIEGFLGENPLSNIHEVIMYSFYTVLAYDLLISSENFKQRFASDD